MLDTALSRREPVPESAPPGGFADVLAALKLRQDGRLYLRLRHAPCEAIIKKAIQPGDAHEVFAELSCQP